MNDDNDPLTALLLSEEIFIEAVGDTPAAAQLSAARRDILDHLEDISRKRDLGELLFVEKAILRNDLDRHANSKAMADSLKEGLAGITAAEKLVAIVDDSVSYGVIDAACNLRKNRVGGVPKDEARQFFKSHTARLLNWDKSRLSADEKRILDRRKANMRLAEDLYAARQRRTLGLKPVRRRDRGPSL